MAEIVKLENGVTVVLEKMNSVRSIAFGIFVKNGSRNENIQTSGISHFIEHLLFKGTKNRTAREIADDMDSVGGQINAYTTKEYTCYYTRTLDSHFNIAIDVLADIYFNSLFSDDDIKKERNVIIEEINMYEDSPEDVGFDLIQNKIWRDNSLGFPILGTEKSISAFDSSIIKKYYKEHYRADNTVLALAGNFEKENVISEIKKYFGDFKNISQVNDYSAKPVYFKSKVKKEKDIEQLHLTLCFPGIKMDSDENYILAVVNSVFGGGMSSRLFQKIREENGLVYTIYSFLSNFTDTGLFGIYAGFGVNQFNRVYELILREIDNFKKEKISKEQLSKTKEQIKSNLILGLESSSARASNIGRSMLLLNKVNKVEDIIEKINKINMDNIDYMINKIFDIDKMSVSIVGKNAESLF